MDTFFSIEKVFETIKPFFKTVRIKEFNARSRSVNPKEIIRNGRYFRKQSADIYHITGDIHYAALFLPGNKTVLTIHDCVFLFHPNLLKRWILKLFWLRLPVNRVKMVTTISEKSKAEILKYSNCKADKIVVIPDPVAIPSFQTRKIFNQQKPGLLHIGVKSNKNLDRVADALNGINCRLEIIGKLNTAQIELLEKNNIDFVNHFNLTDEELWQAYQRNDILLFASLYEGFGLPLIEAQAAGIPVLTSNIEPMKSNSGGAAFFIDPLDRDSIRSGILALIENANLREQLVIDGAANVKKFHPEKISEAYTEVYARILHNKDLS